MSQDSNGFRLSDEVAEASQLIAAVRDGIIPEEAISDGMWFQWMQLFGTEAVIREFTDWESVLDGEDLCASDRATRSTGWCRLLFPEEKERFNEHQEAAGRNAYATAAGETTFGEVGVPVVFATHVCRPEPDGGVQKDIQWTSRFVQGNSNSALFCTSNGKLGPAANGKLGKSCVVLDPFSFKAGEWQLFGVANQHDDFSDPDSSAELFAVLLRNNDPISLQESPESQILLKQLYAQGWEEMARRHPEWMLLPWCHHNLWGQQKLLLLASDALRTQGVDEQLLERFDAGYRTIESLKLWFEEQIDLRFAKLSVGK